jgi:3-hydroxybenzoate 6-monooxygenase
VLADACLDADVELRPGRTVTSVDQSNFASSIMGGTVVTCAGGPVYAADAVLAADGVRSVARTLLRLGEPSGDGWAAYRGTVSADALRPGEAPDEVVAWVGPDAHFTRYPVRTGEVYEQVAVFRSHLYPLVGAVSPGGVGQGGAGQGAGSPRPGQRAGWGGPEELDEAFSWAAEPVRAGVRLLRRDRSWQMLDRVPLPCWADRRVALLGDAVHPMPAYLAQGACQAIEDASAIAEELVGATLPSEVPAALARYQARRAPRVIRVARARQVWETGRVGQSGQQPHYRADDYAASDWLFAPGPLARAGAQRQAPRRGAPAPRHPAD